MSDDRREQGARDRSFARKYEATPIDWRRGFFRVWLLLSAAWIMGWVIYLALYAIEGGFRTSGDFLAIPVVFLGPPIALFVFGMATAWAFRGFRTDHHVSDG